ncbi:MAG TPA: hypothetical protein VHW94_13765, partial [Candidatus Dormibacteraeota bacterium]|nr:hypothetical protein [Candidatus Dormibacteraeota bacterium]
MIEPAQAVEDGSQAASAFVSVGDLWYPTITDSLIRSRSGGLVAALTFSTLATGVIQICLPLELRQLQATPNQIGLTLAMFGFGMFAFEW